MANWLDVNKYKRWIKRKGLPPVFIYDDVTDEEIEAALLDVEVLAKSDVSMDWQDAYDWDNEPENNIAYGQKWQTYRIAALVKMFRDEGEKFIKAIDIDTFYKNHNACFVEDGHHRIRALQYLKIFVMPFCMSGHEDLLEEIINFAGIKSLTEIDKIFCLETLAVNDSDIEQKLAA